ncbi:NADP-dependent oxidoreductase domain-containing protein [Apiospora arundinis]|uniref:NADP-dependent oxidoreductase domain-containing protein n=1 Tax=Apiospora arundinis TaxID=335852 RepID=A0ABR2IDQ5_9PEZI
MAPQSPQRYAYVTLITRASYLAGVVLLADTLRRHGSRHPLIVLYTPKLSGDAVRALELEAPRQNMVLRRCGYLLPPGDTKITLIAERFEDTWTKLRVFELCVDFDVVCYLDADMAVFRNPDAIFDRVEKELPAGWLGANHCCVCNRDRDPWAPADWHQENCAYTPVSHPGGLTKPTQPPSDDDDSIDLGAAQEGPSRAHRLLNGGMFVFRPTPELRDSLLSFFSTNATLLSTFKFPDQDFLARYFRGRWHALGWQYNALKTMRYWHPNLWRDEEVVCLHYIVDKPWAQRVGEDGVAGYKGRDGVTHQWWWQAYKTWEAERLGGSDSNITSKADYGVGMEVVKLVRKGVAPPLGVSDGWFNGFDPDMQAIGASVQGFANNRVPATPGVATKA